MTDQCHTYQVSHPDLGTLQVSAADRYAAVVAAAKEWGERWTQIASACTVTDLGSAKLHLCRLCGVSLDAPGLCPRCQEAQNKRRREIDRMADAQRRQRRQNGG